MPDSVLITGDADELTVSADVGDNTQIDGEDTTDPHPLRLPWRVDYDAAGDGYRFQQIAVTSNYASADQYRDRNRSPTEDDDLVDEMLSAAARYIDRRLGWCPGAFAPIASATIRFWPGGPRRVLRLRDTEGAAWPLRTWTEISVDYGGSGTPDHTWTPAAAPWIVAQPAASTVTGRPYRSVRIQGSHDRATESIWPSDPGYVDVTSPWGWDTTPGAVREMTIHVARSLLDSHAGGAAAVVSALESGITLSDGAAKLWRLLEMEYSAGRMGRVGVVASAGGSRR